MVSPLHNVRLSTVIIVAAAAAVIILLFPSENNINNALLQSESAFAQVQGEGTANTAITNNTTTEPMSFLPYQNPIYGIFMQYPSDWIASTAGLADYIDLVAFYSPLQNVSDLRPARLKISVINYAQNISLPEFTDVWTIQRQSELPLDVKTSEVTFAGYPGYTVVLAYQPFQNSTLTLQEMNTWTTIGNKAYILTYEGEESAFNQHLPEVNQMLESLVIRSDNNCSIS